MKQAVLAYSTNGSYKPNVIDILQYSIFNVRFIFIFYKFKKHTIKLVIIYFIEFTKQNTYVNYFVKF